MDGLSFLIIVGFTGGLRRDGIVEWLNCEWPHELDCVCFNDLCGIWWSVWHLIVVLSILRPPTVQLIIAPIVHSTTHSICEKCFVQLLTGRRSRAIFSWFPENSSRCQLTRKKCLIRRDKIIKEIPFWSAHSTGYAMSYTHPLACNFRYGSGHESEPQFDEN